MKKLLLCLAAATLLLGGCKSKLDKKDKSLKEMQEDEGNTDNYKPVLSSASATPVYKKINDTVEMHLNIYFPDGHKNADPTPVIVYFFGGAFIHGSPSQFENACIYFAGRGITAVTADYRVISRNKGNAFNCLYDAKSAVRYLREHAEELNIDPNRIAVGGGSAGGFLAIECALDDANWQDPNDNAAISSKPNALVLLNPVVNAMEFEFRIRKFKDDENAPDSTSHAAAIDPMTHIHSGMPPAIVFHGTADKISAYKYVQQFCDAYTKAGNSIDLHTYENEKHGFTAEKYKGGHYYYESLQLTDAFLVKQGYLTGASTVVVPELKETPIKQRKVKPIKKQAEKPVEN